MDNNDAVFNVQELPSDDESTISNAAISEFEEREDEVAVDDSLPGVDQRPVMRARVGHVQGLDGFVVVLDGTRRAPRRPT